MSESPEYLRYPMLLRRRLHPLSARYNRRLLLVLPVLLLLPLLVAVVIMFKFGASFEQVVEALAHEKRLWMGGLGMLVLSYGVWAISHHESLMLSLTGIEYRSPFRGPLAFLRPLMPDWSLPWQDMQGADLQPGRKIPQKSVHRWKLEIRAEDGRVRTLEPYAWYGHPDTAGFGLGGWLKLSEKRYLNAVRNSPLHKAMDERALFALDESPGWIKSAAQRSLDDLPGGQFDLSQHTGCRILLVGLALLGGYAIIDGAFLAPWRYLEMPPLEPFAIAAAAGGFLGLLMTVSAPRFERGMLAILLAAAAAGVVYPAALRFNVATDPDGVQQYAYRQVSAGIFEAADGLDLPRLEFTHNGEFWEAHAGQSMRWFKLARGEAGFWQLYLSELRDEQRDYYEANPH